MKASSISLVWSTLLFFVYITTSCVGLYFIKAASGWKTLVFFTGVALYVVGAVMWMGILRIMPLSFAFPIAAGSLVIGTMLTGTILLKETVTNWQAGGALMIIMGIALIASNR